MAGCAALIVLAIGYSALIPKPFPVSASVFEQCTYAVNALGPEEFAGFCKTDTRAADVVAGYHLWEKYAPLDPEFPWLAPAGTRCRAAVAAASIITITKLGVGFADIDKCMFEQDRKELVEHYFALRHGMAKR